MLRRQGFGLHDMDPAGKSQGERLALLARAIEREEPLDRWSIEELWELSKLHDMDDEDLNDAVEASRLAGLCILDPDFDAKYGPGCPQEDLWIDDFGCAFPELRTSP